ncbi:MAG: LuxR C-terminal-related transcriptional regulator [Desulfobacteraceae bacterium]|nr:LuxR C-terminal-related transcriptional regulator [Desulfobacteraceae bacterium]
MSRIDEAHGKTSKDQPGSDTDPTADDSTHVEPKCYSVIGADTVSNDTNAVMRKMLLLQTTLEAQEQELRRLQQELRKETDSRKIAQKALREQSQELEMHSTKLVEANGAIKVLLSEREEARLANEERVTCNVNALIRPYLLKLSASKLNQRQRELLDAITRGLDDITSPLSRRFILESCRLSPVEMKVAGLIRHGRTTKEIAGLLGVADSTIDFHRLNLRRKLNLKDRHINLQNYLKSLL